MISVQVQLGPSLPTFSAGMVAGAPSTTLLPYIIVAHTTSVVVSICVAMSHHMYRPNKVWVDKTARVKMRISTVLSTSKLARVTLTHACRIPGRQLRHSRIDMHNTSGISPYLCFSLWLLFFLGPCRYTFAFFNTCDTIMHLYVPEKATSLSHEQRLGDSATFAAYLLSRKR
jgi:hypothetical protein